MINEAICNSIYEIIGSKEILSTSETANLLEHNILKTLFSEIDLKKAFENSKKSLGVQLGDLSIKGLMIRVGRSSFEYLLNKTDNLSELTELEFRLLSRPNKIWKGLNHLSESMTLDTGLNIKPDQDKDKWYLIISEDSDMHRESNSIQVEVFYGFFQEFMYWVSGGRTYNMKIMHNSGLIKSNKTIVIEKNA